VRGPATSFQDPAFQVLRTSFFHPRFAARAGSGAALAPRRRGRRPRESAPGRPAAGGAAGSSGPPDDPVRVKSHHPSHSGAPASRDMSGV